MIAIKLSVSENRVLTFDGNVLELFYVGWSDSNRYHVTFLDRLELKIDRRGNHSIVIHLTDDITTAGYPVDENVVPIVTNLIAEIESAKTAFQFD